MQDSLKRKPIKTLIIRFFWDTIRLFVVINGVQIIYSHAFNLNIGSITVLGKKNNS